ncbi:hypothetical protein K1719_002741 [Acacia pycnantha]|nr:hypothetical protein K1719_002741 [Acacia pycnantha]
MNPASRSGNYEYNKLPLSLEELYKGCRLRFKNSRTVFDSRGRTKIVEEILKIDVEPDIVKPDTEIVVQDEGMPSASKPGQKGNLRINFDIIFPSQLSTLQKCQLKKIFSEVDSYS